jgi:hypothetical protein
VRLSSIVADVKSNRLKIIISDKRKSSLKEINRKVKYLLLTMISTQYLLFFGGALAMLFFAREGKFQVLIVEGSK